MKNISSKKYADFSFDEPVRLQKFLAAQGVASRRSVEDLIRKGIVFVDGKKAVLGQKVIGNEDIRVSGKKIIQKKLKKILLAFYKPRGMECTMKPSEKKSANFLTLGDFDFGIGRVFPVGRLDKYSEGLLFLTNDGQFANEMMHPRYEHEKEYEVTIDKKISAEKFTQLLNGSLELDGKRVQPCSGRLITNNFFTLILKEGRNRQIRRMCELCGFTVKKLKRIRINKTQLGNLRPGEFKDEII